MGSIPTYLSVVKLQPWFLNLQWKTCLSTELQPWFLPLQWNTCPCAEHSGGDDDDVRFNYLIYLFIHPFIYLFNLFIFF